MQTGLPSTSMRRQLGFVAGFFPYLQGYRFLPLAALILGFALWLSLPVAEGVPLVSSLLAFFILQIPVLLLAVPIGRWYSRRFGVVRPRAVTQRWLVILLAVGLGMGLVNGVMSGRAAKGAEVARALTLPPGPFALEPWVMLGTAAVLLAIWLWSGRASTSSLFGALVFGAQAVLTLAVGSPVYALLAALPFTTVKHAALVSLLMPVGIYALVGAFLDHRLLLRTFAPSEPSEPEVT